MNQPKDDTRHSLLLRLGESRNELAWELFYDYYQGYYSAPPTHLDDRWIDRAAEG